jgi:hypothetical protein
MSGVAKVTLNGVPLMDVTDTTVDTDSLLSGNTALRNNGDLISGAVVTAPASNVDPAMDGTASAGSASTYSRGDHVHPTDTSRASSTHVHGDITNGGDITATATIANGDRIVINDESASKVTNSSITFGTSETTFLSNKGTWVTPAGTYSLPTADADTLGGIKVGTNLSISEGVLSATDTTYTFDGTYNASTNKAATVSTVTNAINALDGGTIGTGGTTKTITSLSQSNGNVSATFEDIAFPVTSVNGETGTVSLEAADVGAAASSHSHGSISNSGAITSDTTVASGDKIVITDSSNSSKLKRSGIAFGTATTTFLRNDGSWETPAYPVTSVNTKTGAVSLSASDVGALPDSTTYVSSFNGSTGAVTYDPIPSMTGNSGKFLTTDGTDASWATVDALPSQTGNSGKFLTTDGTDASWTTITQDDHKWGGVSLGASGAATSVDQYIPVKSSMGNTSGEAAWQTATVTPGSYYIAKYDGGYLKSTTPASGDSSTKVATTAFVGTAISALGSVLNYKGTKTSESALPSSGNVTGDVWIVTADNSEYVWNGSSWEKLGPTIDLSGYVPTSRTVNGKALSTDISLTASDVGALADSTTIPQGTVTSVRVQATSPVQSSTNTAQSTSLNTTISLADGYGDTKNPYAAKAKNKVLAGPTTGSDAAPTFRALDASDIPSLTISKLSDFPSQSGNSGKFLTTNGSAASWAAVDALPSQTDQSGKFLTTNGTTASWATVNALPSQTGNSGKFLTTNGSAASWATVDALPSQTDQNGKFLTTNGTTASWATVSVPTATSTTPAMDGTAAVGSETTWAKGDHVHPTDTSRQAKITASGILKGNGSGTVSAATAGTDYVAPSALSDYMQKGVDYVTAGQKANTTLGTKATAEGNNTTASGSYAHAEGNQTTASGTDAHAEGSYTTASGQYAHAEGSYTTANHKSQHVFGEYNVLDTNAAAATARGDYVEIVGKGTADNARSNARTLDWNGNETLAGKLTLGAGPTANMDATTKTYVDTSVSTAVGGVFPSQSGNSGKVLATNGTSVYWMALPEYTGTVV